MEIEANVKSWGFIYQSFPETCPGDEAENLCGVM